jgi:hypothetical protein
MLATMLDFMHEGGLLMCPLFIAGVATLVMATRRALLGSESMFDVDRLARALLVASLAWSAYGMRLTCGASYADLQPDQLLPITLRGISEALAPAIMGMAFFAIASVISALPRARTLPPV